MMDRVFIRRRIVLPAVALVAALGFVSTLQRVLLGLAAGRPQSLLSDLPSFLLWCALAPGIVAVSLRFEPNRLSSLAAHLIALFVCVGIDCLVFVVLLPGISSAGRAPGVSYVRLAIGNFWFDFVLYSMVAGLTLLLHSRERSQREKLRAATLQQKLVEARLHALQLQLHPHFLFNTLNSISELMHLDVAKAEEMLSQLAELLRASLQNQAQTVPLGDELRLVARYLQIQSIRFSDRLRFELHAPPDILQGSVPSFLLQPLVENAVRHGIAPRSQPGRIDVRCAREGARLRLEVIDDGVGLCREPREGVGLTATRERLLELYSGRAELTLQALETGGARTTVLLPWVPA